MISKRLLRFALGPSFLDPVHDPSSAEAVADAENKALLQRLAEAERAVLSFVGLGAKRASVKDDPVIVDLHTSQTKGVIQDEVEDETARTQEDMADMDSAVLMLLCTWTPARIRVKAQTFTLAPIGYGSLLYREVSTFWTENPFGATGALGGMLWSLSYEIITGSIRALIPDGMQTHIKTELGFIGRFVARLGRKVVPDLVFYPLLQRAMASSLGLVRGPSMGSMWSSIYWQHNWQLIAAVMAVHTAELIVPEAIEAGASRLMPNFDGATDSYARSCKFMISSFSHALADFVAMPLSTYAFRMLATKYASSEPIGCDFTTLASAMAGQWAVTVAIVHLRNHLARR